MYPEEDKPSAASGEDTGSAAQDDYDVLQDELLDALVRRGNGA